MAHLLIPTRKKPVVPESSSTLAKTPSIDSPHGVKAIAQLGVTMSDEERVDKTITKKDKKDKKDKDGKSDKKVKKEKERKTDKCEKSTEIEMEVESIQTGKKRSRGDVEEVTKEGVDFPSLKRPRTTPCNPKILQSRSYQVSFNSSSENRTNPLPIDCTPQVYDDLTILSGLHSRVDTSGLFLTLGESRDTKRDEATVEVVKFSERDNDDESTNRRIITLMGGNPNISPDIQKGIPVIINDIWESDTTSVSSRAYMFTSCGTRQWIEGNRGQRVCEGTNDGLTNGVDNTNNQTVGNISNQRHYSEQRVYTSPSTHSSSKFSQPSQQSQGERVSSYRGFAKRSFFP